MRVLVAPRAIGSGLLLLKRALLPCCLFSGLIAGSRSTSVQRGAVWLMHVRHTLCSGQTSPMHNNPKDRPAAVGGAVHDLTIACTQAVASIDGLFNLLNWHCSPGGGMSGDVELLLESQHVVLLLSSSLTGVSAHCSIIQHSGGLHKRFIYGGFQRRFPKRKK